MSTGAVIRAKRQTEAGYDVIEAPLPAVVSVADSINDPRYPSLKSIMGAKKKPQETLTAADLEIKLLEFQRYFNGHRAHAALDGRPPEPIPEESVARARFGSYRWQPHWRGLYHTPMAA